MKIISSIYSILFYSFIYGSLAIVKLNMQIRLTLSSQRSACLCFCMLGLKAWNKTSSPLFFSFSKRQPKWIAMHPPLPIKIVVSLEAANTVSRESCQLSAGSLFIIHMLFTSLECRICTAPSLACRGLTATPFLLQSIFLSLQRKQK